MNMNKHVLQEGGILLNAAIRSVCLCLALFVSAWAIPGQAAPHYLRSTVQAPWGESTNETAMTMVFGGTWVDARYETVSPAALFTAANTFIFMEGGDDNADELEAFLTANSAAIAAWVAAGGKLFVNAAPNEGDGMSFGFGVTLTYPDFPGAATATAANAAHPIFAGPFTPVTTAYTGSFYSHASVSGGGIAAVIVDGTGDIVLGELALGAGCVFFGGMTTTNFHSPQPQALNLRANMISYLAACGAPPPADPAPEANLIVNGNVFGEEVTTGNPVSLEFSLRQCGVGNELFLVMKAPALGINVFSYLTMTGQWVPLPGDLSLITPFMLAPADGRHPLFMGTVPKGVYDVYFGCDFMKNGHLDYQFGHVDGAFDHVMVTVQ